MWESGNVESSDIEFLLGLLSGLEGRKKLFLRECLKLKVWVNIIVWMFLILEFIDYIF